MKELAAASVKLELMAVEEGGKNFIRVYLDDHLVGSIQFGHQEALAGIEDTAFRAARIRLDSDFQNYLTQTLAKRGSS